MCIITLSYFRISHTNVESSKVGDVMDISEREKNEITAQVIMSEGPSPDLMSGMKPVLVQMVKTLEEGSLTSEPFMDAIKKMSSSKVSKIIQPQVG